MKNVAVILSGCGVFDGSEIQEAVLTLLALAKAGARYQCLAPNMEQRRVVNHLTQQEIPGAKRNVLEEAARIARGEILNIADANIENYAAMIFPGGYGAALNLSDFALKGEYCTVQADVLRFAKAMAETRKPAGFICIAPALISKIYGSGVKVTVGNDKDTAKTLENMGATHIACPVHEIVIDEKHKVITTPAYMLAQSIDEAAQGIESLVRQILAWA